MRIASILVSLAAAMVLVQCNEQPSAAAAGAPEIELKAAVAEPQTVTAAAPIDGRLATVTAREGNVVKTGDVLATLTNASLERDLASVRAEVALAQKRLRDAREPIAMALVLGDAGARERAAAEILRNREAKRDRYRDLYKTHDISKQELEDAENEYSVAMRDWLGERERQTTKVVRTDTDVLEMELERAKANVAFVEERRGLLVIKAPMDGTITRVLVRQGDTVYLRDPIAAIANNTTMEVRAPIAPELISHVRAGMPVEVKVLTVPPRRYTQPIAHVTPAGGTGGAAISVQIPNPDGMLQPGQNAVVTVR
ncbi:MAG: rane fusion protein multidrug efflux system [Acidobacteriota bacterium]|nr:rane fusion protein multidrug efflux system [Acidobacteriota bacterium]